MNVEAETLESRTSVSEQATPGEILRRAREAKRLSHSDIAKQLKLRVQWIVDIENNHFTDASALIYVRGYIRAYARMVNVSVEEVIRAFDEKKYDELFVTRTRKPTMTASEEQFVIQQPVLFYSKAKGSKNFWKKIFGWFAVIGLLMALIVLIMWLRSEHTQVAAPAVGSQVTLVTPTVAPESVPQTVATLDTVATEVDAEEATKAPVPARQSPVKAEAPSLPAPFSHGNPQSD